LSEGPRAGDIKPSISESQELQWELSRDWRLKQQKKDQGVNEDIK